MPDWPRVAAIEWYQDERRYIREEVIPYSVGKQMYLALIAATAKLMEHQRGESGLDFEPAHTVVRPALEILAPAIARYEKEIKS